MSNLPPVMDDDEFFMLLSYYNTYGFPPFSDTMASPADAVSITAPDHEFHHDWMPILPVQSFVPDGGTPISTVPSLPTTPFWSSFPSTPNFNQIDLPYLISPPLHLTSQCPTFPPIALQDYENFSNSPEFHPMLNNSQMPTGNAESEYCIVNL